MGSVLIYCDNTCPERFSCKKFDRCMDFVAGKYKDYEDVKCDKFNQYEK